MDITFTTDYETPSAEVVELRLEGAIDISGPRYVNPYEEGEDW